MRKESRKERKLDKKASKAEKASGAKKMAQASELAVENVGQRVRHTASRGGKLFNGNYDFGILVAVLGLTIFGVAMVFSASYYSALNDPDVASPYYYLIRQGFWACAGIVALIFGSTLNYHVLGNMKLAKVIVAVSIILLALLFTPLGVTINGATRWLDFGITIMPGEIAKLAAIIGTSAFLAENPKKILSFKEGILPLIAVAGIYFGLIAKQPNLSTALIVVAVICVIAIFAGLNLKYIGYVILIGIVGVAAMVIAMPNNYHVHRLTSFLHPFEDSLGDGFQVVQSLLALGSGGLFGTGIGKSVQKTLYLPEPQNDFILAIIGEELGFVGIIVLMATYAFLMYRGFRVALNAKDHLGMLLAGGITSMLGIQVIMNIAVVTSSMPCTGVTLPFISYGGNAMILFMLSMGILLNISRQQIKGGPGSSD